MKKLALITVILLLNSCTCKTHKFLKEEKLESPKDKYLSCQEIQNEKAKLNEKLYRLKLINQNTKSYSSSSVCVPATEFQSEKYKNSILQREKMLNHLFQKSCK